MPRSLLVLVVAVVLAYPPSATAQSSLTFDVRTPSTSDDTVEIVADPAGIEVGISVRLSPQVGLPIDYKVSFAEAAVNNSSTQCPDISSGAGTDFDCDPEPDQTEVTGSADADSVTASCSGRRAVPLLHVDAGAGDDEVTSSCAATLDLGAGDDAASLRTGRNVVDAGDGADDVNGGVFADILRGQAGSDRLRGSNAEDRLEGGEGNDQLDGGVLSDRLLGGPGRDLLIGGAHGDDIDGGDGVDTVSYEDHEGTATVSISLNGAADDGESGENDRIDASVENVIGSGGDDLIAGDAGLNDIDSGDGGDVVDPGGDSDFVDLGAGSDRVSSRDGAQDRIACGGGSDLAITDEFDVTTGCEVVQASRELMPDVDNDGVPLPADCDDNDARRRPGLPDKPGNGFDEDCNNGDAPFGRILTPIQSTFSLTRRGVTRVRRLRIVDVPAGSVIALRCAGGKRRGCFRGVRRRESSQSASVVNVRDLVRRSRFKAGAVLEVRVLHADLVGKVVRFRMRARRLPQSRTLCLVPGGVPQPRC